MLAAESAEPVIGRHEQVMPGDTDGRPEGRPAGVHRNGCAVPLQLRAVVQRTPCRQGPAVHLQGGELLRSTGESQGGPGAPEALAVPVVESDIPHG